MPSTHIGPAGLAERLQAEDGSAKGPLRMACETLRPRRRLAVMGVAAAMLFALLATGGPVPAPPAWLAVVGVLAVMAGAILATYVPERGWRPDLGCTPCAAASVVTVVVAAGLVASSPHVMSQAVLALGVLTFGLFQRLSGAAASCLA